MSSRWVGSPKVLGGGNWLQVSQVKYLLPTSSNVDVAAAQKEKEASSSSSEKEEQKFGLWEVCQRTTTPKTVNHGIDACEIIVNIKEHGATKSKHLGFISQYRPPLDSFCLEFCAGLVDEGENPIQAALRELSEETGIADGKCGASVKVLSASPPIAYEPGLTTSCCSVVEVEVSLSEEVPTAEKYQKEIRQHSRLEEAEQSLQLIVVPVVDLMEEISKLQNKMKIDAKVFTYCIGKSR